MSCIRKYGGESDGSSTDENKRKRSTEKDDSESFTRSKKTPRTPTKFKTDEKDRRMEELMRQMMEEIKAIRQENKSYKEEIIELRKENREMKSELAEIRKKVEDLATVEWKLEKLEREKRKNNIVITGLELRTDNEQSMVKEIERMVRDKVGIDAQVKSAYQLNNKMIIVEVENFDKKLQILKNKHMLKAMEDKNIYISSDLTAKEREIQKIIRDRAKEERRNGKQVKSGYQKLEIDGNLWRWNHNEHRLIKSKK